MQRPQPRERPLLIDAGEPTVADDIRSQNSRELSGLAYLIKCEELLCQSRLKECLIFKEKDRCKPRLAEDRFPALTTRS